MTSPASRRPTTAAGVFRLAAIAGIGVSLAVAVVGSLIGWFVIGERGIWSALVAGGIGIVLAVLSLVTLAIGARIVRNDPGSPLYLGVMLAGWLLKFGVFLAVVVVLRGQDFLHPVATFLGVIAVVIGSVIADVVVVFRARVPVVDDGASRVP